MGGGHNVGWIANGEWLGYELNVPASGQYDLVLRYATNSDSVQQRAEARINGQLVGETDLAYTGGWQSWSEATITNVSLEAGSQTLQLNLFGGLINFNWLEFRPVTPANSLLSNGGFESGLANWLSCSSVDGTQIVSDPAEGSNAAQITDSDCLYQLFDVTPNETYTMQCQAKGEQTQYTDFSLTIYDENDNSLSLNEVEVTSSSYQTFSGTSTAAAGASYGAVTFYSEDTGVFDACTVVQE